jgi:hypothetical protein
VREKLKSSNETRKVSGQVELMQKPLSSIFFFIPRHDRYEMLIAHPMLHPGVSALTPRSHRTQTTVNGRFDCTVRFENPHIHKRHASRARVFRGQLHRGQIEVFVARRPRDNGFV